MARSEISKQTVKNYLEYQGKDLGNEMKSKIEKKDNWSEFKNELAVSIATYAKKPTFQTKQKLSDLISINFSTNLSFGRDALDEILKDLGIGNLQLETDKSNKKSNENQNRIEYRRSIFNDLGYEFPDDIVDNLNKQWQYEQDKKYGIVRKNSRTRISNKKEKPKEIELEEEDRPEKEDGKIKKALKKAYFKMTASIIMAPGKVPEEMLAENRELFKKSSEKLDKMIAEVNKARDIIINQNHSSLANIPDDLQELYSKMSDGNFAEIDLENFESELEIKSKEQVSQIREKFEILQKQRLENKLRKLAEEKGFTGQELEDEIEYAVLDSKLDEDGDLVLPAHSIFKEIFDENDGNIKATPADIIKTKLITYISSPKISELSDEEIMNLGKNFGYPQKMNPKSKQYAVDKYFMNNPEVLPDDFTEIRNDIRAISNQHIAVTRMLEETELRHKLIILDEIQSQFSKIDEIIQRCDDKEASNGELDRKDSKKRETVLKIARTKVNSLEKAGLSQVVSEGEKKQKGLLKRAKGILMPDLENAKNKQSQRLQEEYKMPEEQEQ